MARLAIRCILSLSLSIHMYPTRSRMYRALRNRRIMHIMMRTVRTLSHVAIIAAIIPALYFAACILLLAFTPVS